eukprot:12321981-Alexandrium_andersonii.AAC.1
MHGIAEWPPAARRVQEVGRRVREARGALGSGRCARDQVPGRRRARCSSQAPPMGSAWLA